MTQPNQHKQDIRAELARLEDEDLPLAWYMLEGSENEHLVKEEISDRIAKRKARAFFTLIPRFAI